VLTAKVPVSIGVLTPLMTEVGGGDGVVLLRQRWRTETARHGAAQGQHP
jgi:hypothetical protein